jgi:hypothetical protein
VSILSLAFGVPLFLSPACVLSLALEWRLEGVQGLRTDYIAYSGRQLAV